MKAIQVIGNWLLAFVGSMCGAEIAIRILGSDASEAKLLYFWAGSLYMILGPFMAYAPLSKRDPANG